MKHASTTLYMYLRVSGAYMAQAAHQQHHQTCNVNLFTPQRGKAAKSSERTNEKKNEINKNS